MGDALRLRKHWKRIVLAVAAALVLLVTLGLPYLLATLITRAGTRPQDLALTSTPADYGLEYENVSFESPDGIRLRGWYLGSGGARIAVAVGHGLFRSRREVLDRAAFFRRAGYDALDFDFRAHGESDGERVSLGYHERLDFEGAVRFLRERNPGVKVFLYGVSMGAAAALLAAAETPDIAAVIADSPFTSIEETVVHHVRLVFGLPRFPIASALLAALEMRAGFDREAFDVKRAVARMGSRPVLILAGGKDRRMPAEVQRRLTETSNCPTSSFRSFSGAGHGAAYRTAPEAYEETVREFLRANGLATRPEVAAPSGASSSPGSR